MKSVTFYVPDNYGIGKHVQQYHHEKIELIVLKYATGCTWLAGALGKWKDHGRLYTDDISLLEVVVDGDNLEKLVVEVSQYILVKLEQKAVAVKVVDCEFELIA